MRRKPYPLAQLTGGLNVSVDPVFLTDTQSPNLKMLRYDKGLVKKDLGFTSFGTGKRVMNATMEANIGWAKVGNYANASQSNVEAHAGSNSWLMEVEANNQGLVSNNFRLVTGRNYSYSAWVFPTAANTVMALRIADGNGGANLVVANINNANANAWTEVAGNFTANTSGNNANVAIIVTNGANSSYYIDDVQITSAYPADDRIMYFDTLFKVDGTEYMVMFTPKAMYLYDDGVWDPVPGADVFTGTSDNQFSTTTFYDVLIITNGVDSVKEWDGVTFSALGGLGAPVSLTAAECVIAYNSRIVLGNTTEGGTDCPYRVRWSATGQSEQWDPATYPDAGFIDLVDTPDWVVGFGILVDRLFVFKERSIWELVPTKDVNVFEARLVIDGVGTYCEASIVSLGDVIIFFGTDDVYLFDGSSLKSVGENLFPWFYTTGEKKVNMTRINRAASVYIEELGDYILCLPTIGDDPDWMVRYNVNDEHWTQRDYGVTAFGFWSQSDFTEWSEATGYWDDALWATYWGTQDLPPGAPITLLGTSDGSVYQDNRLTTSTELMVWESKDFVFAHTERVVAFALKCKGSGDFTITYSTDQGRTWSAGQTFTPDANDFTEEKLYLNVTCENIRFRVTTIATDFQIMWVEPWYIDRSRSKDPSVV